MENVEKVGSAPVAVNKHNWKSLTSLSPLYFDTWECIVCGFGAVVVLGCDRYDFVKIRRRTDNIAIIEYYDSVDRFYSCNEWLMIRANE